MVARGCRYFLSAIVGLQLSQGPVDAQPIAAGDTCVSDPQGLACCEPSPLPCGIQSPADCGWSKPPAPTDPVELRLRALGVRLDGDLRDALGRGGRCLRTPACSPDSGSTCARSLFRSRRAVARVDRVGQFNDDVDPGPFGVFDSPLLAAGHGDGYGTKSGFQVSCPLIWFAPDSDSSDGVDDSFLYLAWDVADVQRLADPADLVTPVPFDGDGNGSACFGLNVTPGDNRDERYEAQLRSCVDLRLFDPRNRDMDGLLNHFEARLASVINGLAKEPSQNWLHAEISTPVRALAFRDYGRLHRRIASFPTADGLLHQVDAAPTNPSNACIQTEWLHCRGEIERTCRVSGRPCAVDADCPILDFCDGKSACDVVQSCFFNSNNVELVVKSVETSGLLGPVHGRCRKTGRDCRVDAGNTRLCPRVGVRDPLCCDVNDSADVCDEVVADGADARKNRLALAQLDALFRADTDEDAAAEEEAVVGSFTSVPGIEVQKRVRCAGQRVCDGTQVECRTAGECPFGLGCVEAPFAHESPHIAPGAVLEFEIVVQNTGNEDLDVTLRDLLEEVDLDSRTPGVQTLSRCEIVCESTCSISGSPCDEAHPCAAGEACVPPIQAFLTSPRRSLANFEITSKNAERPPVCSSDRSQCLVAAFFAASCSGGATVVGLLDAIRLDSTASLGTLLGARAVRTGDACALTEGDSIRIHVRARTSLAPGVGSDSFCMSAQPIECRNRVSAEGRIVEPVYIRTGEALGPCTRDEDCDDGLVCNGVERCGANGQCQLGAGGVDFCPRASVCNALEDPCRFPRPGESTSATPPAGTLNRPCATDAECDDGKLCNGVERCRGAVCVGGPAACATGLACDEHAPDGDPIDPCGKVVARDGLTDDGSSVSIDLLCRDIQWVKEVGFPQCPCSFTAGGEALSLSARCEGVEAGSSNCCCDHRAPGCQDQACRATVCAAAPSCCDDIWNSACAALARQRCAACAGGTAAAASDAPEVRGADAIGSLDTSPDALGAGSPALVSAGAFVPLTIQYRLTATNRGDVAESVSIRDEELCRGLQAALAANSGKPLVASDCAICPPPAMNAATVGPTPLAPGRSVSTTCTVTFRTEEALNAFLMQDSGNCSGGGRSGSSCAATSDCPGGVCMFPSCAGEPPIRSVDGADCHRNCAEVTAQADNPWLRPVSLTDFAASTVCLHPCELKVCKQVRCLDDCDVNRPGPWHASRTCSMHPDQCCEVSADCPDFDPADPTGPGSEQCVDQPPMPVAPGACLQYRITVTNPADGDVSLCGLEFSDEMRQGGVLSTTDFARVPYDVTVVGRRCEDPSFGSGFNVIGEPVICKLGPVSPGGVSELRPGDSLSVLFRADLKPANELAAPHAPENGVRVGAQSTEEGCSGAPAAWSLSCSGGNEVSVETRLCGFEVSKDVTCENPRNGIALRTDGTYEPDRLADVLPGTRVWFRVDLVNTGGIPIRAFDLAESLSNTVTDGCGPSWFVPHSVVATIGGSDVTSRICINPIGDCNDFGDLSGRKDFSTRPIAPGERLVITYAVEQPSGQPPFAHRGTEPPDLDCKNAVGVSLVDPDLSGLCVIGNPCLGSKSGMAAFNIKVPDLACAKEACLDRDNDGDCADAGDLPFSSSLYLSPPAPPASSDPRFPLTVLYRMTARNVPVVPNGQAETALSEVEICDAPLADAIRVGALTCLGGSKQGTLCKNDDDCPGVGARCGDARCRGGANVGAACSRDSDCPSSVCGVPACVAGTSKGNLCHTDDDCPVGVCRAPVEAVNCALVANGSVHDCASVGALGTTGASVPSATASLTCAVRFHRPSAWEWFSAQDGGPGACGGACFRNEAGVHAIAATGACVGGGNAGAPCAAATDCSSGVCRTDICGSAELSRTGCATEVCVEPTCALEVVQEARCLPDCDPSAVGDEDGWVRDPSKLPAVPGACVEYRVTVRNTATSGIRVCRLRFTDEMLVDGLLNSSDFVGGPIDARLLGRKCQGFDIGSSFNWTGTPVDCTLLDPSVPGAPRPLEPGESVVVRFIGRSRTLGPDDPPTLDQMPTNRIVVSGDGTCAATCAGDRSAEFSCQGDDETSLRLQACGIDVVNSVGCPESIPAGASEDGPVQAARRGEGSTPLPDDCEIVERVAGVGSTSEVLPGSTPVLRLGIENTGVASVDRVTVECDLQGQCDATWFDGEIAGTILPDDGIDCSTVFLCHCSGTDCQPAQGLCGRPEFRLCCRVPGGFSATELTPDHRLELLIEMHIPEASPPAGDPLDCASRLTLRAGTAGCSPQTGCVVRCTESHFDVLAPRLDCEKEICADLDGDGECEEFRSILDLGPNPPTPFDLVYRFRLLNTGDVDLTDVRVADPALRSNGSAYVAADRVCDLAADTGATAPIALSRGEASDYFRCTLRFMTLEDFERFADSDGRPNNSGEICHTNSAKPSALVDPPPDVCPTDAPVKVEPCAAEVCTRKCEREACPPTTTVRIDVFNENESKFSGLERCVDSWDDRLLSAYADVGVPNYFWRELLGTNKGMARIDASASGSCGKESVAAPLVGVATKLVLFTDDHARRKVDRTGLVPVGLGAEVGTIWYDTRSSEGGSVAATSTEGPVETPSGDGVSDGTEGTDGVGMPTVAGLGNATPVGGIAKLGSLLVFPKIELKWDARNQLIQDTFIDVANNHARAVRVQAFLVESERCGSGGYGFDLTMNQPAFWSASRGDPRFVPPLTTLGDGCRDEDPGNPGGRVLRGYLLLWAVDAATLREIRWNNLKGDVLVVNYAEGSAWEYEAWAFQALAGASNGRLLREPFGRLDLDGVEYDAAPDELLLDFYAVGARFGGLDTRRRAEVDTGLTLWAVLKDFRGRAAGRP